MMYARKCLSSEWRCTEFILGLCRDSLLKQMKGHSLNVWVFCNYERSDTDSVPLSYFSCDVY